MNLKFLFSLALALNSFILCEAIETKKIQTAHLSGSWYPADKAELKKDLNYYFSLAEKHFNIKNDGTVVALIAPHAGYYFSGLCAATSYQTIKKANIDKVIIIGPSHNQSFHGIALPDYKMYKTPLGSIPVDQKSISILNKNSLFKIVKNIHQKEHSIEIQLPFLQFCLNIFSIVPLIVGNLKEKDFKTVAQAINELLRNNKRTLIVISSDFIHYGTRFGYKPAFDKVTTIDTMAIDAIINKSYSEFDSIIKKTKATICGANPIKILLKLIETGDLGQVEGQLTSYYNSAQIENSRNNKKIDISKLSQVIPAKNSVSYAGLVFRSEMTSKEKRILLKLARDSITKKLFPNKKIKPNAFSITKNLRKTSGAFVTLKKLGQLRGCIGIIVSDQPLYKTIPQIALSSAFQDSRFAPLTKKELDKIIISITILTPPKSVNSYKDIIIGKHGIILEKVDNGLKKSAVYLPQVATEQGWNLTQTLNHLSEKANLKKDAWKKGCTFKVFEAFEFSE